MAIQKVLNMYLDVFDDDIKMKMAGLAVRLVHFLLKDKLSALCYCYGYGGD